MKKELKTEQDYLDAHLKEFEAMCDGNKIKGIVYVEGDNVFLLQNVKDGIKPYNEEWKKYGYKYSYFRMCFGNENGSFGDITIDQWQPKFGEVVIAYNDEEDEIKQKHIFLFKKDGLYHCVTSSYQSVDYYHSNDIRLSYHVSVFNFVKQIESPKPIEISLEEAKNIIAKEKGVNVEQINLNFNIK